MVESLEAAWVKFKQKPPALERRPTISSHLIYIYDAYETLKGFRTRNSEGSNPISYSDIVMFANINGFADTPEELSRFVHLIQVCDNTYLEYEYKKRAEAVKNHSK